MKHTIDEHQKVTLTLGQLKRLVREGIDFDPLETWDKAAKIMKEPEAKRFLDYLNLTLVEYLWNFGNPRSSVDGYFDTPAGRKVADKLVGFITAAESVKESRDDHFDLDLRAEYKKRLEKYASMFGYENWKELEAAMDKDYDLRDEVIATDDGDNFLDLYLNWWPDVERFAKADEYYNRPLDEILKGIIYKK